MHNHLFVVHGDISELSADAIAYSTSPGLGPHGDLYCAFESNVPGFAAALQSLRTGGTDVRPGHSYWLPLDSAEASEPCSTRRLRGVVVVVSVGLDADYQELSRIAVRGAIETALAHLKPPAKGERLLLALPTFLLGQGGGRDQVLANARAQVETALELLASHEGRTALDVAFVAYTPSNYHAFLRARRDSGAGMGTRLGADIAPLVSALRRRECVLFMGGGVSSGAGLQSWDTLVRTLEARLEIADPAARHDADYYLDLAQWYRERTAADASVEPIEAVVRREFGATRGRCHPTLAHYMLLGMAAQQVVTTNYDDLIERALDAVGRPFVRVTSAEEVALTGQSDRVCVVKFHGDAASAGDVVISRDDYDAFFSDRPAMALLLESMLLNQTFFFVGYSLRDPNFRQVYHRIARMLRGAQRPAFAATVDAFGPHAEAQWRNKQLRLILPEGDDPAARAHGLLRFLDALSEAVAAEPHVFLAGDSAATPGALDGLRARLQAVGTEVERLTRERQLAPEEIALVAKTLGLLSEFGFRPESRAPLSRLWERLARMLPPRNEGKRSLLAAALTHTENQLDTERLRAALAEAEAQSGPAGGGRSDKG